MEFYNYYSTHLTVFVIYFLYCHEIIFAMTSLAHPPETWIPIFKPISIEEANYESLHNTFFNKTVAKGVLFAAY